MSDRAMILIAEPEEAIRESIEMILIDEGYDCHAVADTEGLLRAINIHDSNLIIADIDMIFGDIKEVLSALHQYTDTPPPILITLTYERVRDMLDLMKLGVSEYLLKPFLFEDLLERVHRVIHIHPSNNI